MVKTYCLIVFLFTVFGSTTRAQQGPPPLRLALKDHWEYMRLERDYYQRQQALQARQSESSTGTQGRNYDLLPSRPYKYTKKELEQLRLENEAKAEAGNMDEIYRCIAYYDNKGDNTKRRYWMEKACTYRDAFYCVQLLREAGNTREETIRWLEKAYYAGIEWAFDDWVSIASVRVCTNRNTAINKLISVD